MSRLGLGIVFAVLFGSALAIIQELPERCVPGLERGCKSVYDNEGVQICTSKGYWGDHCFVFPDGHVEEL